MPHRRYSPVWLLFALPLAITTGCRNDIEAPAPIFLRMLAKTPHKVLPTHHAVNVPVPSGPGDGEARFVDVANAAGLLYQWRIAGTRPLDILQTIGNGCGFLDFNNDGNLDVLLIGPKLALYQGDGHGHFKDVSRISGLGSLSGHFLGCAVGDYDNDGYDDVYVSGYRTGLLLHNEGGRGFRDVTPQVGLVPQPWGTSCAWADVNGDGRLDLYVGNYAAFDPRVSKRLCDNDGLPSSCGPLNYSGERGALFLNHNGVFQDVTTTWQAAGGGKTLGAAFADYDDSGHPSLYLANDEQLGDLLHNRGTSFQNVGRQSGTAWDSGYRIHGGMGMDWGDYDNDGRLDFVVATFHNEPKAVYHNQGDGLFDELSPELGLAVATRPNVAFGVKWFDYDNDGWLDLMLVNGHVQDNIHEIESAQTYRQATQLFHNDRGERFVNESAQAGTALQHALVGRGLAVGDYDNDGRMDALVVDSEGTPLLLHNEGRPSGHWLSLVLEGTKSNRDGYGAIITVKGEGLTQTRLCHSDGSYFSASDKRVHVGLGIARTVQSLTVRWPSGRCDVWRHVPADQQLTLIEGSGQKRSDP